MKNNRILSFLIIVAIYTLAAVIGLYIFNSLSYLKNLFIKLLVADVCATVVVYIFSLILKNASVYDPYWSVQPIVICFALAIGKKNLSLSNVILLAIIATWGIRLTLNWAYTFKNLTNQDWRYTMLKEKTGIFYPIVNLLGTHMFPTIVVWLLILPVVLSIANNYAFNPLSVPFYLLSIGAILLESFSDVQMHSYKKKRDANFIRRGLWKYSRHPNYLGEILMWWGVVLSVFVVNLEIWNLFLGAIVNTLMFLFISIPMADKRQAKKKGYEEYKNQTRMLLPIKKTEKQ